MFATPPSSDPSARAWGVVLGTIMLIGVVVLSVSAKTVQLTFPLLLAVAVLGALFQANVPELRPGPVMLCVLAFLGYAAVSALWAPAPVTALGRASLAIVIVVAGFTLSRLLGAAPLSGGLHMAEGLWVGFGVGVLYALVETLSDQAIKIWVYNALGMKPNMLEPARYFTWQAGRLIAVHSDDLKRNALSIPLLLWPALMATRPLAHPWRTAVTGLLVGLTSWVVFAEPGQTTKLAFLAGSLSFILAHSAPRTARAVLTAAWGSACLGVVPAALLLHKLGVQDASWLQPSGQQRILIWNEIAHLVLRAPFLGVGANMTYVLKPPVHDVASALAGAGYAIPHPHNVYLQVWFELGLIGALLFLAVGLCCLTRIAGLKATERPYAFALFAAGATAIASSYNMWQIWLMCLSALVIALYALARKVCLKNQSDKQGVSLGQQQPRLPPRSAPRG
jgi:hypothetical protein